MALRAILADDVQGFVKTLKNFFANIPYNLTDRQNEQMWQAIVYVILKSVGFGVNAEVLLKEPQTLMATPSQDAVDAWRLAVGEAIDALSRK